METKEYNSKLRALISIRNFKKAFEQHFEQLHQIEENLKVLNKNALSIIEAHCTKEQQEKWELKLVEVNDAIFSINNTLRSLKEKVLRREISETDKLLTQFDIQEQRLKEAYQDYEKIGFEILPESEHKHWKKDVCNFEDAIFSLIISHVDTCKFEIEMIEKYTPMELDKVTQIIADHIPENFTFEDADKYERDYKNAVQNFKKEFKKEKNLWDKFLDILAGGTHQPPSERVMLQRWINGEKDDDL